jgi:hypothetical protein
MGLGRWKPLGQGDFVEKAQKLHKMAARTSDIEMAIEEAASDLASSLSEVKQVARQHGHAQSPSQNIS